MDSSREEVYKWFKTFSNTTYSCNVVMDITKLIKYTKDSNTSFFINLLYIVVKGLDSIPEMHWRYVNDEPKFYEMINPGITVMTKDEKFRNVRFNNCDSYQEFYNTAHREIEIVKNNDKEIIEEYNPKNVYNDYYITCLPWVEFTQVTHPIPDDKGNQSIPRICWGKYYKEGESYKVNLNITVSHMFVDGYPLAKCFNKIQELLDDVDNVLK